MLSRVSAYVLAGIPAAIGVAFVARYAFVTSDTEIDGAANAFLFGMIAAGAFAGPACAIAVGRNGPQRLQSCWVSWLSWRSLPTGPTRWAPSPTAAPASRPMPPKHGPMRPTRAPSSRGSPPSERP